jgi:hypothetical protein
MPTIRDFDRCIHSLEEFQSFAELAEEKTAFAEALATLKRIRDKALDRLGEKGSVLQGPLRVSGPLKMIRPVS